MIRSHGGCGLEKGFLMSQFNAEPRLPMAFMSSSSALVVACSDDGKSLVDAFSMEELAYAASCSTCPPSTARGWERGEEPLI